MDSEKAIEKKLVEKVSAHGGVALKFYSPVATGYPDRIVMMPHGQVYFVELKSEGKKPTRLQAIRHDQLRQLGFSITTISTFNELNEFINCIHEKDIYFDAVRRL